MASSGTQSRVSRQPRSSSGSARCHTAGRVPTSPGASAAAAWQHAFGDVIPTAALAFRSGGVFTVAGVPIAVDSALVDAGIDWPITAQIKLDVGCEGELAHHTQVHTAKG